MNINHLSVSRVGVWNECKQKYKYRYHLNIPSQEEEPFYFVYGKIIHKIAEEYVRAEGQSLISEVTKDVLGGRIEIEPGKKAPPLPQEYQFRMPEHLKSVKWLTDKIGFGGKLEHPFNFDLDPPNNRIVKGFIDRLIIREDKCWIIDYKTTKKGPWRRDLSDVTNDLQLRCYSRVVQREFGIDPTKIQAVLFYLEGTNLVGARFTPQSLESVEKELLEVYKTIENADPNAVVGTVGRHCTRCDYRKICPFYSQR